MSKVHPDWNEKTDESGTPINPLGVDTSRNRVVNLFSRGLITSITLRLRYAAVHAWGLQNLADKPIDEDEKYLRLKRIEKLFCLTSRYQQIVEEQPRNATIAGMDGVLRFSSYDREDFEEVQLDDLEILKNDSYGYATNYENFMQKLLLKRGGFTLTGAGEELAEAIDAGLGEERQRILDCADRGRASNEDFQALRESFAIQSVYLRDDHEPERLALEKILLGLLRWEGDNHTGTVQLSEEVPESFELDVLDRLKRTLDRLEAGVEGNKLYQKYQQSYHFYRRSYALFLLRVHQLTQNATSSEIALTRRDTEAYESFRELMTLYWMQVYAGYAIESQLEAMCTFLNSRIPARYEYDQLLDRATNERILRRDLAGVLNNFTVSISSDGELIQNIARNLMLYGQTSRKRPSVTVTADEPERPMTVRMVRESIRSVAERSWDSIPPTPDSETYNEVLLSRSIRNVLNELQEELDDPDRQFECWTRSLSRSIVLMMLCVERFDKLRRDRGWLFEYAYRRLHTRFGSLPRMYETVRTADQETTIDQFGRDLLETYVVDTHLRVFYDRLGPNNLKRALSFDQDERLCLEAQVERGKRPVSATPYFVRFDEMNTLLRDCGLLTDGSEGYLVTDRGAELLSRLSLEGPK